jgi:hypothetical protein
MNNDFKPFKLELEIYSLNELKNLYNRLNVHIYTLEKAFKSKNNVEEWKEVKDRDASNYEMFCKVARVFKKYEKDTNETKR